MSEYFRKYLKRQQFPLHPSDIKFKTYFTNCILQTMRGHQYVQTEADDWNIYWCEKQFIPETLDKMRVQPNKRVNHFRNFYEICRKDLLSRNVKKFKRALEKQGKYQEANYYSYMPLTYNLPSEYNIFLQEYKRATKQNSKTIWIMKPIGRSQGKGIFLFNKINQISEWSENTNQVESYVVQRYIHNPLLIGHKKFDLRIYVLVTSHNPLQIYLYRSGFARFTHCRYESGDINSLESHITNVAYQKNLQAYDEERGGKYQLDKLRLYMLGKYGHEKVEVCFGLIEELIVRTLVATSKIMQNDKRCFELYGFDVMIDAELKPWLIEINGSPSMTASTKQDYKLKMSVLDDTITILNIENLPGLSEERQVGGFDCLYQNGNRLNTQKKPLPSNPNMHVRTSFLGCFNNREQQLRKLAKLTAIKLSESSRQPPKQAKKSNLNSRNISISYKPRNPPLSTTQSAKLAKIPPTTTIQTSIQPSNNLSNSMKSTNRRNNSSSGANVNNQYRISNIRENVRATQKRVII